MIDVPGSNQHQKGMIDGSVSMIGPNGGDLSAMFNVPKTHYHNQNLYPQRYYYNNNQYSHSSLGAVGAIAGAGLGYAKGAALLTGLTNAGILTGGLATVATGGLAPFVGLLVGGLAAGAVGSVLGVHGKDIAKAGAGAVKTTFNIAKFATLGTAKAIGYTAKALTSFSKLSYKHTQLSHQFPDKLQKNLEQQKQAEQKFSQMVKEARKELKQNKDIKEKLSDLQQYRIPSQKAQKEYSDLLADYHIIKSAKTNNGKLDLKQIKKEYKEFAKANNWSRSKLRSELSALNRRVEEHKDNLNLKENNEIDKSFLNQYSKDKVADMQNNFNSKGDDAEKKSVSPKKGHNQAFKEQLLKEVKKIRKNLIKRVKKRSNRKKLKGNNSNKHNSYSHSNHNNKMMIGVDNAKLPRKNPIRDRTINVKHSL